LQRHAALASLHRISVRKQPLNIVDNQMEKLYYKLSKGDKNDRNRANY
jgi:hypothetical protein